MLARCGNAPPMQRNWTRHWMKPVEWSQVVWSRQIPSLPVLAGIAPSDIRRAVASRTERTRQATDERHPLNGHLGVAPRLKSRKSFMTCTKPINTTAKAARLELWRNRLEPLDARVHLNISADEHLPAGADYPWTTWKALNRLRTQVGRSRVNMLKWGFSNEQETCDCGIRQTMQHLLVCPMMDTACSPQDLTTANDIAIGCARHWEGTIWQTYYSWWKDNNDDDRNDLRQRHKEVVENGERPQRRWEDCLKIDAAVQRSHEWPNHTPRK